MKIQPCESHEVDVYTITEQTHSGKCKWCNSDFTGGHTDGDDGLCTLCGAGMVSYVDAQGAAQTPVFCSPVTNSTTELKNGWYVVNSDVTIGSQITVSGTVNLILADNYTLTAESGICVNGSNSLTIYGQEKGTGKLIATGAVKCAGIGSGENKDAGSLTINGGTIEATGGEAAAGIGGGSDGSGGTITISGGTITAKGNNGGAGIGGGSGGSTP